MVVTAGHPLKIFPSVSLCYLSSHTQTKTKWSMLAVSQNYSMCSILYTALFVIPGYSVMVFPTKNRRSPPTKNPRNDPSGRTNRRGLRSGDSSWLRAMHQSSHIPSLVSLVVLHVLYDARLLKQFPSSDTWNVAQNKVMNLQIGTNKKASSKKLSSAARGPFVRETYLFPLAGACSTQWLSCSREVELNDGASTGSNLLNNKQGKYVSRIYVFLIPQCP